MSPHHLCDWCGTGVGREEYEDADGYLGYWCGVCDPDDYAAEWDRAVEEIANRFGQHISGGGGDVK